VWFAAAQQCTGCPDKADAIEQQKLGLDRRLFDLHQCIFIAAAMMNALEKRAEGYMPPIASFEGCEDELPRCFYDASLLFRRMALNQVDRTEVEENDPLLFFELQGICTLCRSKEQCVVDLANEAVDDSSDGWREYCPNATTFVALGCNKTEG